MHPFNYLPKEIQHKIYKDVPISRRINNQNFKEFEQSFYENHCTLPINRKEFEKYINTYMVDSVILYGIQNNRSDVYYIYTYTNDLNDETIYNIIHYSLIKKEGLIEQQEDIDNINLDKVIQLIYKKYEHLYFDVKTVYNIAGLRSCQGISNYAVNYTLKYIDNLMNLDLDGNELDYLYLRTVIILYLGTSFNIINDNNNMSFWFSNAPISVKFDYYNIPVNEVEYNNALELIDDDITTHYAEILTWLHSL